MHIDYVSLLVSSMNFKFNSIEFKFFISDLKLPGFLNRVPYT